MREPETPADWRSFLISMVHWYLRGTIAVTALLLAVGWFIGTRTDAAAPALSGGTPSDGVAGIATDAAVTIASDTAVSGNSLITSTWASNTLAATFTGVHFPTASIGYAVGESGAIRKTLDGGATWTIVTSGTATNFNDVAFADATTGWAVGNSGLIRKTTDGGTSWASQTSGVAVPIYGVQALSTTTAYAAALDVDEFSTGTILKTTDGGTTWTALQSGTGALVASVHFPSTTTGWVVGYNGLVKKTTDSGATWATQTSGTSQILIDVHAVDTTTVYATGFGGIILKTTDGGATWVTQTSGTSENLWDITFLTATSGYAVGVTGTLLQTTNGGSTWTARTSGTSGTLYDTAIVDATTARVFGASVILRSTDSGANWTNQIRAFTNAANALSFVDASTGYAVGDTGAAEKTTDGGATWAALTTGTNANLLDVHAVSASVVWAVGGSGAVIVKTTDGGSTWASVNTGLDLGGGDANAVVFVDASTGWIGLGSGERIIKTTDGGTTWTQQRSTGGNGQIYDFAFVSSTVGYASGSSTSDNNGVVLKTTDGGSTWTTSTPDGASTVFEIEAPDASTVFIGANSGQMAKSTDSGSNWTVLSPGLGNTTQVRALTFVTTSIGYAASGSVSLRKTTDGGTTWASETQGSSGTVRDIAVVNASTLAFASRNGGNAFRTPGMQVALQANTGNTRSGSPSGANACTSASASSDGLTITCSHGTLAPGTWYTLTVTGGASGIQSSTGDTMAGNVTKSFRTAFASGSTQAITPSDLGSAASEGFFTVTGTTTAATQAIAGPEITSTVALSAGTAEVTMPQGTIITRTGGGTMDLSQLAFQNATSAVASVPGTSVAAVQYGIPNVGLTFSTSVTVEIPVSATYNGQVLDVYRDSDTNFTGATQLTTCTVASGVCSFTTTSASYFAVAEPGQAFADPTPPGAPRDMRAEVTAGIVTLTWTDPSDVDLATVEVLRNTPPSTAVSATPIAKVPRGTQRYEDRTTDGVATYTYVLRAVDQSGNTTSSAALAVNSSTGSVNAAPPTAAPIVPEEPPVAAAPAVVPPPIRPLYPPSLCMETLVRAESAPTVYYLGADGQRHPFRTTAIFQSWYADFSRVAAVSDALIAEIPVGTPIRYRPGVRLVKRPVRPEVYAVDARGVLRWITTEDLAIALYGAKWNTMIDDVGEDVFWIHSIGDPIRTTTAFNPTAVSSAALIPE